MPRKTRSPSSKKKDIDTIPPSEMAAEEQKTMANKDDDAIPSNCQESTTTKNVSNDSELEQESGEENTVSRSSNTGSIDSHAPEEETEVSSSTVDIVAAGDTKNVSDDEDNHDPSNGDEANKAKEDSIVLEVTDQELVDAIGELAKQETPSDSAQEQEMVVEQDDPPEPESETIPPQGVETNTPAPIQATECSKIESEAAETAPLVSEESAQTSQDQAQDSIPNDNSTVPQEEKSSQPDDTDGDGDDPKEANHQGGSAEGDAENAEDDDAEDDHGSGWDLRHIFSISELSSKKEARKCDQCSTLAFGIYTKTDDETDKWAYCLDCQKNDFDGWPAVTDMPVKFLSAEHKKLIQKKCSKRRNPPMPDIPEEDSHVGDAQSETNEADMEVQAIPASPKPKVSPDEKEAPEVRGWDLQKVFSIRELSSTNEMRVCDQCSTPAFGVYVKSDDKADKWAYCVDCQENDFEGWPTAAGMPIKFLSADHKELIQKKCSTRKKSVMPDLPEANEDEGAGTSESDENVAPPSPMPAIVMTPTKDGMGTKGVGFVTPPPSNLLEVRAFSLDDHSSDLAHKKATPFKGKPKGVKVTPRPPQPSKASLAIHKRWQDAATSLGGGRIIVSKPIAKKLLLVTLYEAMKPLNITQVNQILKGVVPAPVLSSCLKEMALEDDNICLFDDDSDSDDAEPKKKKQKLASADEFDGTLIFKPGRSANASLYYFDHSKKQGLTLDEKQELATKLAQSTAEKDALEHEAKAALSKAAQLVTEPTNAELAVQLEADEAAVLEFEEEVVEARKLKVNEEHKMKTKRKISKMSAVWRSRKRLCSDFMIRLEEITDGSISSRKCFNGDGQMALDSDESVRDGAIRYAEEKRRRLSSQRKMAPKSRGKLAGQGSIGRAKAASIARSSLANEDFVAVILDSQGEVKRVCLNDGD